MRERSLVIVYVAVAVVLAAFSLNGAAAVYSPQETSTISFALTTTSSYFVSTGGQLSVNFNSVQLDTSSPQSYAFGIVARAAPGSTITRLHWDFGDGVFLDVPYCCQSQVTEVRYHAYQQPGSYTVMIQAYDSAGNAGTATVTVNWATPVPEFPSITGPIVTAMMMALAAVGISRLRKFQGLPRLN